MRAAVMNRSPARAKEWTRLEPIRYADRLLAEAVRAYEQDGRAVIDEPEADAAAREEGGGLESRIVRRAHALSVAPALDRALRHVRQATGWILALGLLLALIGGAGAVRVALGSPESGRVNFFWVLASLLGLQTALLVAWTALMIAGPRTINVSVIGAAAMAAGRWLAQKVRRGPVEIAAIRASAGALATGSIGRWTLSAVSHAAWSAADLGGLVVLVLLLSAKEYSFQWETTILSAPAYERITEVISAAPRALGFPAPTAEQVVATDAGSFAGDRAAAQAWSGLLVGSIVAYAVIPRLALLLLSLAARRRACAAMRCDLSAPGYVRVGARVMPAAETYPPPPEASRADRRPDAAAAAVAPPVEAGPGPPVLLGVEIEPPTSAWPPKLHAVRWVDLGFVDGREDRARVCAELETLPERPRAVVAVCALTTTPDRGLGAFIERVAASARAPVTLALTAGQALRERGGAAAVERRVDDWRALAARAGVADDRVLEIDLEHLTDVSLGRLAALVGAGATGAPVERVAARAVGAVGAVGGVGARRIETAFGFIVEAAGTWKGAPDAKTQVSLHRRIAELYRHEARSWSDRLRIAGGAAAGDLLPRLRESAEGVARLLPARLRRSPKWLAAGAATGALGCVAASMLIAPAAIGALPVWSALGAAISAAIQPSGKKVARVDDDAEAAAERGRADAVRAAGLFALLLELQGRDEAVISRVLERALAEGEAGDEGGGDGDRLADGAACAAWLDEVRHRFDLALTAETRP